MVINCVPRPRRSGSGVYNSQVVINCVPCPRRSGSGVYNSQVMINCVPCPRRSGSGVYRLPAGHSHHAVRAALGDSVLHDAADTGSGQLGKQPTPVHGRHCKMCSLPRTIQGTVAKLEHRAHIRRLRRRYNPLLARIYLKLSGALGKRKRHRYSISQPCRMKRLLSDCLSSYREN